MTVHQYGVLKTSHIANGLAVDLAPDVRETNAVMVSSTQADHMKVTLTRREHEHVQVLVNQPKCCPKKASMRSRARMALGASKEARSSQLKPCLAG